MRAALAAGLVALCASSASAKVADFEGFVADGYVGTTPTPNPLFEDGVEFLHGAFPSTLVSEATSTPGVSNTYLTATLLAWFPAVNEPCCQIRLKSFDFKAARSEDVGKSFFVEFGWLPRFSLVGTADWVTYTFDDIEMTFGDIFAENYRPTGSALFAIDNFTFENVEGVPEPSVWATMIVGLGLAGARLRRLKRAALGAIPQPVG